MNKALLAASFSLGVSVGVITYGVILRQLEKRRRYKAIEAKLRQAGAYFREERKETDELDFEGFINRTLAKLDEARPE